MTKAPSPEDRIKKILSENGARIISVIDRGLFSIIFYHVNNKVLVVQYFKKGGYEIYLPMTYSVDLHLNEKQLKEYIGGE